MLRSLLSSPRPFALAAAVLLATGFAATPARAQTSSRAVVVDDFESYTDGAHPDRWKYITRSRDANPISEHLREGREDVRVRSENGNQFVRASTRNESLRFTRRVTREFDWDLEEHPYLQWRWRVNDMPRGADTQDVGAGVLVTFDADWLGRPKSVKYVYSTTLPVGTVVDEGTTHTLVVASGRDGGNGSWSTVTRNVVEDIERLFDESPPYDDLIVTLWSDSDEVKGTSEADFDDVRLLSER